MSLKNKNYLDGLSVVSTFIVVLAHTSASRVYKYGELSDSEWFSAITMNAFSRFSIPLLLILSGIVFLQPIKASSVSTFYKKHFAGVLITLIFWCMFYFIWLVFYYEQVIDIEFIKTSLLSGLGGSHYYYLFVIAGLCTVTPLLLSIYNYSSNFFVVLTIAMTAVSLNNNIYSYLPVNAFTYFIPFLMYFMLGAYIAKVNIKFWMVLLGSVVFTAATYTMIYTTKIQYVTLPALDYRLSHYISYQHAYVFAQTISAFLIIKYLIEVVPHDGRISRFFKTLAPATLGIYIIHVPLLDLIRSIIRSGDLSGVVSDIVIETILGFTIATLIALLMLRVKFLRRTIS